MINTLCISSESNSPATPELSYTGDACILRDYCRTLIKAFLTECKLPYHTEDLDDDLFKAACDRASEHGCCMSGSSSIIPYLQVGTLMGSACYGHREFEAQLFMTLFTAYVAYLDDACAPDASLVSKFVETFTLHQPQGHPVLDALASLLLEMPDRLDKMVSNLALTSALNLVTSWLLEAEIPHVSVS